MKFVANLSDTDREALQSVHRSGKTHRERQRAHAILLSAKGYTLDQLADICDADRETVSRWLDHWQTQGPAGLVDAPKSGRPRKLDALADVVIQDAVDHPAPDMKRVLQDALEKRGFIPVGLPYDAIYAGADVPIDVPAASPPKTQTQKRKRGRSGH